MSKALSYARPERHRGEISQLATWLLRHGSALPGQFYFLTLTFDRYRSRYLMTGGDGDRTPTREEVIAGLTRPMPAAEIRQAYVSDLDHFYKLLLRVLLGSRYCKLPFLQPVAVGALDQPAYKRAEKCSLLSRRPGENFDHAHFVVFVRDAPLLRSGESLDGKFQLRLNDGTLERLWRRINAEGEIHVKQATDLFGALDYAAKTAKLSEAFHEHIMMWPLKSPLSKR